jgi:sialidase-1
MPTWNEEIFCHPSFVRIDDSHILMTYIYRSSMKPLFGHNYYRRSIDEGATWGDQFILTPNAGYNIIHNDKLLRLSTGRIVAPGETQMKTSGGDHSGYGSFCYYSDDNGYTWWRSKNDVNMLPIEAQEPQIVELKDGRLMMLMRSYSGFVSRAYSEDQGVTWSKGEPVKELRLPPHSTSAFSISRIPSTGDLLLMRCVDGPKDPRWRTPFVSVISKDDGETWENERVIGGEPDNDYGYPSVTYVDEDDTELAIVSYHQQDGLHVARIGVDWFYSK